MLRKFLNDQGSFCDKCGELTFVFQRQNNTALIEHCFDFRVHQDKCLVMSRIACVVLLLDWSKRSGDLWIGYSIDLIAQICPWLLDQRPIACTKAPTRNPNVLGRDTECIFVSNYNVSAECDPIYELSTEKEPHFERKLNNLEKSVLKN